MSTGARAILAGGTYLVGAAETFAALLIKVRLAFPGTIVHVDGSLAGVL